MINPVNRWRPGRHDPTVDGDDDCPPCPTCVKCRGFPKPLAESCWVEHSGSWTITVGAGASGSDAGAILLASPTLTGDHGIRSVLTTAGRLIVCFTTDQNGDDYVFGEVNPATGTGTAKISRVVDGGAPTEIASKTFVNVVSGKWRLCRSGDDFVLSEDDSGFSVAGSSAGAGQDGQAGLGVAAGLTNASFNEDTYAYLADASTDECEACIPPCTGCDTGSDNTADTLTVDLTGTKDPTACFGNCASADIEYQFGLSKVENCKWRYEVARVDWKVYKIEVDASISPPRIDIWHRANCLGGGQTDQQAFGFLNGSRIPDCSDGNFSAEFVNVFGGCIGAATLTVTG